MNRLSSAWASSAKAESDLLVQTLKNGYNQVASMLSESERDVLSKANHANLQALSTSTKSFFESMKTRFSGFFNQMSSQTATPGVTFTSPAKQCSDMLNLVKQTNVMASPASRAYWIHPTFDNKGNEDTIAAICDFTTGSWMLVASLVGNRDNVKFDVYVLLLIFQYLFSDLNPSALLKYDNITRTADISAGSAYLDLSRYAGYGNAWVLKVVTGTTADYYKPMQSCTVQDAMGSNKCGLLTAQTDASQYVLPATLEGQWKPATKTPTFGTATITVFLSV